MPVDSEQLSFSFEVSILVVVDVGCDAAVPIMSEKTVCSFNPCCGGCRM